MVFMPQPLQPKQSVVWPKTIDWGMPGLSFAMVHFKSGPVGRWAPSYRWPLVFSSQWYPTSMAKSWDLAILVNSSSTGPMFPGKYPAFFFEDAPRNASIDRAFSSHVWLLLSGRCCWCCPSHLDLEVSWVLGVPQNHPCRTMVCFMINHP